MAPPPGATTTSTAVISAWVVSTEPFVPSGQGRLGRCAPRGSPGTPGSGTRWHSSAFGCGAKITALPALSANIALHIGVTMGLVTGHTAATTPIGLATNTRLASASSPMIPRDFLPLRLFQMTRALPRLWHLVLVHAQARFLVRHPRTASALSKTYLPKSRTMASTCSCEKLSKTAWATRARATSRRTCSGVVEDEAFTLAPRAISAVGLTMRVSFRGWRGEGRRRRLDRRLVRRSSADGASRQGPRPVDRLDARRCDHRTRLPRRGCGDPWRKLGPRLRSPRQSTFQQHQREQSTTH